jgi:signal transduction histidine kinase
MIADAPRDPRASRGFQARFGIRAVLGVPLLSGGEPIGAIIVGDKRARREFTEAEVGRVVAIANHLASAIANARLYEDLKQSYDDLSRAQQALVERERLAALGELAAVVAHEVRNPLGVIWNSLNSLRRMLKPSGDVAVLLEILGEESERLNRIVGDLLDFARPHAPELRPEPIEAIIAGAMGAIRAAPEPPKPIAFSWDVPSPPLSILADARMLRQAFVNLFLNAIQAMSTGGRITIRATVEEPGSGPARVCIEVSDDGPGIPPEMAAQVFQPFFTTKATGTGLGLAVVKRIVDAHRGEVSVARRGPEGGTTFTLRLPLAR